MAEGTPVKYEDLTDELKKKYDEIKAVPEADLIGSFHSPVNTLERVALRVIQEIMSHRILRQTSSGTHHGERPLQSRPTAPSLAAPEVPSSSAYVVYKIGESALRTRLQQQDFRTAGGTSGTDLEQTWLAKYATPTNLQSSAPAVGSELEKQAWLAKYATPANLQSSTPAAITADQICTILKDQFGMMPKRRTIGYSKPYPNEYELIPLPPKYRLPDFTKFNGSDGSSSIEHVSRYLAQPGDLSIDELRVRFFAHPHRRLSGGTHRCHRTQSGLGSKRAVPRARSSRLPRLALPI
ncbi:hypothetical protein QYE76_056003 [Lolium multiflorum]|uniref:Uncharacterized protein n=1 Tax=Lolium multiflorum TaxID=4521 RepID=A0AAD8T1V3_LOLMU|nr:hypothetical protein QYE76_056003 [Lolium multiflorum]